MSLVFWIFWAIGTIYAEATAIARHKWPLTEFLRLVRFDNLGQFIIVPLLFWLPYHIVFRPKTWEAFTGYDLIPIVLGVAWCIWGWK